MTAHFDASELVSVVRDFRARGGDLSPIMAVIAESFVAAVSDNFDTAGHGAWPPLAESTLLKRRGNTAEILKDTGRLAGSIYAESGDDFAEVGTDVSYAVFHVSKKPRKKIPLRDFLAIPDDQLYDEPAAMVLEYVANARLAHAGAA